MSEKMDVKVGEKSSEKMTPRQGKFWDRFSQTEVGASLIDRLGLEVVETAEVRRGRAIAERVEGWIDQIGLAPVEARRVERDRKPWDEVDLSYLKPGECPF